MDYMHHCQEQRRRPCKHVYVYMCKNECIYLCIGYVCFTYFWTVHISIRVLIQCCEMGLCNKPSLLKIFIFKHSFIHFNEWINIIIKPIYKLINTSLHHISLFFGSVQYWIMLTCIPVDHTSMFKSTLFSMEMKPLTRDDGAYFANMKCQAMPSRGLHLTRPRTCKKRKW